MDASTTPPGATLSDYHERQMSLTEARSSRTAAGLPRDLNGPGRLLFDPSTKTWIFSCASLELGRIHFRLFIRRHRWRRYVSIDDLLFKTYSRTWDAHPWVVTSWVLGRRSHLFTCLGHVNGLEGDKPNPSLPPCLGRLLVEVYPKPTAGLSVLAPRSAKGISEVGIARLNLRDLSIDLWSAAEVSGRHVIVASLVGTSETDHAVYAVLGKSSARPRSHAIEYHLARMIWSKRTVQLIAKHPRIWF